MTTTIDRSAVFAPPDNSSIKEQANVAIRIDLQRISELDADIEYPCAGWFDAVPRRGEVIQMRDGGTNILSARTVVGVNYLETEPNFFRVLVVVE